MGMLISYPNDKKTSGGGGFSKLHQDLVSGQVAKRKEMDHSHTMTAPRGSLLVMVSQGSSGLLSWPQTSLQGQREGYLGVMSLCSVQHEDNRHPSVPLDGT